MNAKGWTIVGIVVLIVGIVTAFVFLFPQEETALAPRLDVPDVGNLEGENLYANGEYGFTLRYPSSATLEEAFSPQYHLAPTWRANAGPDEPGTPVLSILMYETESDMSYPRYYRTLVRIGVSDDANAVASCEKEDASAGEEPKGAVLINGTEWQSFSFEDAGMHQYVRGVSYRVLRDGKCFAMEAIAAGSSYRDEPSDSDVPQQELDEAYEALQGIVLSFSFVSP